MPVASPTATRRFSATSPDYEFAVPGFRPTGNTSHLFGRETTQFDATPTQLDLSDDDNDTPFVIAPAPQRPPPYQRAPIGDVQESIERAIEMLRARIEARKKTWPDGRPSRYYDDVPGVEESKGDRNYPDGDRPEPYGGDYEDESDDEDDSDGAGSPEDDSDDDDDSDDEDDEDDSDSDDERRGAEVEAIRNFGLISRRQMQELSAVVDNAEMRTIEGEPETTEQRDLAKQIAKAIAGTSSFTKQDTLDKNGSPKPLSELMRMARVTSLWPVLSDLQKDQYMQTTGVLANDRHYIARNVLIGAPIRKKRPFVINAQGKKIQV
jgi:hypothetical protein